MRPFQVPTIIFIRITTEKKKNNKNENKGTVFVVHFPVFLTFFPFFVKKTTITIILKSLLLHIPTRCKTILEKTLHKKIGEGISGRKVVDKQTTK